MSTSKMAKPGKHVLMRLPRLRFFDCGNASLKFLMDLEKTIGAPGELYKEPHLKLKVKHYAADSELSPSLISNNEAFDMNFREEVIAVHLSGSGEDYNPYKLPLLWGAKA